MKVILGKENTFLSISHNIAKMMRNGFNEFYASGYSKPKNPGYSNRSRTDPRTNAQLNHHHRRWTFTHTRPICEFSTARSSGTLVRVYIRYWRWSQKSSNEWVWHNAKLCSDSYVARRTGVTTLPDASIGLERQEPETSPCTADYVKKLHTYHAQSIVQWSYVTDIQSRQNLARVPTTVVKE